MPLVINSLRGRHTCTQTCTHTDVHTKSILRNQVHARFKNLENYINNEKLQLYSSYVQ